MHKVTWMSTNSVGQAVLPCPKGFKLAIRGYLSCAADAKQPCADKQIVGTATRPVRMFECAELCQLGCIGFSVRVDRECWVYTTLTGKPLYDDQSVMCQRLPLQPPLPPPLLAPPILLHPQWSVGPVGWACIGAGICLLGLLVMILLRRFICCAVVTDEDDEGQELVLSAPSRVDCSRAHLSPQSPRPPEAPRNGTRQARTSIACHENVSPDLRTFRL